MVPSFVTKLSTVTTSFNFNSVAHLIRASGCGSKIAGLVAASHGEELQDFTDITKRQSNTNKVIPNTVHISTVMPIHFLLNFSIITEYVTK
jgi:hypothetical protein